MAKATLEWNKASTTGQKKEAASKCGRYRITWMPGGPEVTYYVYCDPRYVGSRKDFGEAQQLALNDVRGKSS